MRQHATVALLCLVLSGACTASEPSDALPRLDDERVEVLGVWQAVEAERFRRVLDQFQQHTGAVVTYTSTEGEDTGVVLDRRIAAGNPPELAIVPQPGLLESYARDGRLVPIDGIAGPAVRDGWAREWQRLGSVDGRLYGVWFKAANKSLVWYNIAAFERAGVVPPSDLVGLVAVVDTLVAHGLPGFALGAGDAWTLTDWFENLYLRLAGPENYDALAQGRLRWTHPTVHETLSVMASLLSPPRAVGGPEGVLNTSFEDSVRLVFGPEPAAAMVMEGDFVGGAISGSTPAKLGVDADVFPFPDVDPARRLVVGGGDAVVMFTETAASTALLQYLATPAAAEVWARIGGFVSANQGVDLAVYPDPISEAIARSLIDAGDGFRFDLSDLQPAAFGATSGQGLFGILAEFVAARDRDVARAAARLEDAAVAARTPVTGEGLPRG